MEYDAYFPGFEVHFTNFSTNIAFRSLPEYDFTKECPEQNPFLIYCPNQNYYRSQKNLHSLSMKSKLFIKFLLSTDIGNHGISVILFTRSIERRLSKIIYTKASKIVHLLNFWNYIIIFFWRAGNNYFEIQNIHSGFLQRSVLVYLVFSYSEIICLDM